MTDTSRFLSDTRKIMVIVGGSGDIGRAIAIKAAQSGYFVCIGYKSNSKKATNTLQKSKIQWRRPSISGRLADASSLKQKLIEFLRLGELRCLINCVGLSKGKSSFCSQSYTEIEELINVNLLGVLYACKDFVETISDKRRCQDASIVNFSSLVANSAGLNLATYATSKAGVAIFSKALAKEVGPLGIRVNAILPGKITGEMNGSENQSEVINTIPIGRYGSPEEVANLALWLVSEEASYITGSCIEIAGGR